MTTTTNTTTVQALTAEIADLVDDLTGFHPALDRAVSALAELAVADLDIDRSQSAVAALGGLADGSFATLLGLVVRHIASPDHNPALANLPTERKQTLRRLGAEYAAGIADRHLSAYASEASAAIEA